MPAHPRATRAPMVLRRRGAPIDHPREPEPPRRLTRDSSYHSSECVCPRCDPDGTRRSAPPPDRQERAWLPKLGECIAAATSTTTD